MKKATELQKLLIAVALISISIAIDVIFKRLIPIETFGLPFYAIPIVLGSIVLHLPLLYFGLKRVILSWLNSFTLMSN